MEKNFSKGNYNLQKVLSILCCGLCYYSCLSPHAPLLDPRSSKRLPTQEMATQLLHLHIFYLPPLSRSLPTPDPPVGVTSAGATKHS